MDGQLHPLGYREGQLPLSFYDEDFDPETQPFAWRAVAPAWRAELVAA